MSIELRLALQDERAPELAERVRRLLGPFNGKESVLDVGSGTGALALAFAPHVGEVVGVDMDEAYLGAARERAPANARFVAGDATALPFGYAEFDIAATQRLLHHVRRPELVVSELVRVTRPGGRVFVIDQLGSVDPLRTLEMDRSSVRETRRTSGSSRRGHPGLPRRERPRPAQLGGQPRAGRSRGGSS